MQRFFRRVEVAEQTNQRGENSAELLAINRVNAITHLACGILVHDGMPPLATDESGTAEETSAVP